MCSNTSCWSGMTRPYLLNYYYLSNDTLMRPFTFIFCFLLLFMQVFTLEIVNEDVRTKLGNLVPFFLVLGNTFCFAIGSFTPWWVLSLICSMFPALEAILLCWFPETPRLVKATVLNIPILVETKKYSHTI